MSKLDWKLFKDWRQRLIESFPDELTERLFRLSAFEDRDRFYSDDLSWLNRLRIQAGHNLSVELDDLIAADFGRAFRSIRTYHACRPTDVGTYLRSGLELSRPEQMKLQAFELFGSLGVTRAEIDHAYESHDLSSESGVLFLSLDDRDYVEYCGHYLIYGSERLQSVAAGLHPLYGSRPRALLREQGIPTIFDIDLPIEFVDQRTLAELVRNMLEALFKAPKRIPRAAPNIDFTFTVKTPLPAACIRGHSHPASIRDPNGGSEYRTPATWCAHCDDAPKLAPTRPQSRRRPEPTVGRARGS